jgi:site-specific recombinase XerD
MAGRRAFTREEEARILKSFKGKHVVRNKALFTLMMKTGLRVSEALSLRVRQVVSDGEIVDEVEIPRAHMKGKKAGRHVMLNPTAQAALRAWLTEDAPLTGLAFLDPDSYVFTSRAGNKPMSRQWAWKVLKVACAAADVRGPTGCHSTRKSFAERAFIELGRDLHHLQAVMGHSSISSTIKYLGIDRRLVYRAFMAA